MGGPNLMAILTRKKYRFGGTLTANDADGLPVEFHAGDPVPDDRLARLGPREIQVNIDRGMLREIGAPPAPRPPEAPPKPMTLSEILQSFGLPTAGPRGVTLQVLDRAPRDRDLTACTAPVPETTVLVHEAPDGTPVGTISLVKLLALFAVSPAAR